MGFQDFFKDEIIHYKALTAGHVVPDSSRCVQCGICSYNCPIGIDVRAYVWRGQAVQQNECLTCGECIVRCPRGVLRFAKTDLFAGRVKAS